VEVHFFNNEDIVWKKVEPGRRMRCLPERLLAKIVE
jgi:hypothetical protein